jgi:hypothetical protein
VLNVEDRRIDKVKVEILPLSEAELKKENKDD